jgi:hypothetical protein
LYGQIIKNTFGGLERDYSQIHSLVDWDSLTTYNQRPQSRPNRSGTVATGNRPAVAVIADVAMFQHKAATAEAVRHQPKTVAAEVRANAHAVRRKHFKRVSCKSKLQDQESIMKPGTLYKTLPGILIRKPPTATN